MGPPWLYKKPSVEAPKISCNLEAESRASSPRHSEVPKAESFVSRVLFQGIPGLRARGHDTVKTNKMQKLVINKGIQKLPILIAMKSELFLLCFNLILTIHGKTIEKNVLSRYNHISSATKRFSVIF